MGHLERQAIAIRIAMLLIPRTYTELIGMADDERAADACLARLGVNNEAPPFVALTVGSLGRLRRRIAVEITVIENMEGERPGCVYFERYRSGKLVVYGLSN